jgi:ethanolamine ammonia-lyase small subunit
MTEKGTLTSSDASHDDELWADLRQLTAARIGLARAGAALSTGPLLDFRLAHARARDAVIEALDEARLARDLAVLGAEILSISSAAPDRQTYLMRPDLGRRLAPQCGATLAAYRGEYDAVFVVADGLSARAVQAHAEPVLAAADPTLRAEGWRIGPLLIVRHGRVAIGDAIATALGAKCVAVLIGERPGLSAPDSMGAYLTWQPHAGTTDAQRNCISNIRPEGIDHEAAALKLVHLLDAMRARGLSGVGLKDGTDRRLIEG